MTKGMAIVMAAVMLLAACGGDDEPSNAERPETTVTAESLPDLVEPTPTAVPVEVEPEELTYTVQQGDLLGAIAQSYGVSLEQLLAANPEIDDPNSIQIGDVITIPPVSESADSATADSATAGTESEAADTAGAETTTAGALPED